MTISYRPTTLADAVEMAPLNARLILDEGHRNAMTVPELQQRMEDWLKSGYQAVIFESGSETVGYALFRHEPEYLYIRHLFVIPEQRRKGIARNALDWMKRNVCQDTARARIEVLVGNKTAIDFWHAVGFTDYCIAMEKED